MIYINDLVQTLSKYILRNIVPTEYDVVVQCISGLSPVHRWIYNLENLFLRSCSQEDFEGIEDALDTYLMGTKQLSVPLPPTRTYSVELRIYLGG